MQLDRIRRELRGGPVSATTATVTNDEIAVPIDAAHNLGIAIQAWEVELPVNEANGKITWVALSKSSLSAEKYVSDLEIIDKHKW
ncbi:MAG: hypothetical protein H7836_15780, partial [Magnetococcus sp. YQC-3]